MKSLSDIKLSSQQLHRLFLISLSAVNALRHDVKSRLVPIFVIPERIKNRPELLASHGLDFMNTIEESAKQIRELLDRFLLIRAASHDEDPFITQPDALINSLRAGYSNVSLRSAQRDLIEIVYPSSSLYIVLNELAANARKHIGDSAAVAVSYQMRNERFQCIVEDNGPGISTELSAVYQPLDILFAEKHYGEGLSLVAKIVESSEGMLLFRRSETLGGTEVLIDFPVIGCWYGEDFKRFSGIYEY